MNIFRFTFQVADCGVIEKQLPALFQCAAGENAVAVIIFSREQSDIQMFPVHKVFADRVSPVHRPPYWRIGEMLIKKMISALIVYKSVRVVHPVTRSF